MSVACLGATSQGSLCDIFASGDGSGYTIAPVGEELTREEIDKLMEIGLENTRSSGSESGYYCTSDPISVPAYANNEIAESSFLMAINGTNDAVVLLDIAEKIADVDQEHYGCDGKFTTNPFGNIVQQACLKAIEVAESKKFSMDEITELLARAIENTRSTGSKSGYYCTSNPISVPAYANNEIAEAGFLIAIDGTNDAAILLDIAETITGVSQENYGCEGEYTANPFEGLADKALQKSQELGGL